MYINFGINFISISKIENKTNLIAELKQCNEGSILLNTSTREEVYFFIVRIFFTSQAKNTFGIGIISESHGLLPHILLLPEENKIFFGLNEQLIIFDSINKIATEITFNSLFFRFIHLIHLNIILVLHETGILSVNAQKNKIIWKFDGDIIEDFAIEETIIKLKFIDQSTIIISLNDGQIISPI